MLGGNSTKANFPVSVVQNDPTDVVLGYSLAGAGSKILAITFTKKFSIFFVVLKLAPSAEYQKIFKELTVFP